MATIELRDTPDITINNQLINSLERYAKYCLNKQEIRFIGKNASDEEIQNSTLSVPVYYQSDPNTKEKDPFFSFHKLILGQEHESLIPECFKTILEEAKLITETINKKIPTEITVGEKENKKEYKIERLNIQSGTKNYWDKKLEILNCQTNTFYIFYWKRSPKSEEEYGKSILVTDLRKMKRRYSIKDKIWGHSKFLRDFLKKNNYCYEIEVEEINCFSGQEQTKDLILLKIGRQEQFQTFSSSYQSKVDKFCKLYSISKNITLKELSLLHIYNSNQFCDDAVFEHTFVTQMTSLVGNSHQILHKKDDLLLKFDEPNPLEKIGAIENKLFFNNLIKNISRACVLYKNFKSLNPDFVFLDDIPPDELNSPSHNSYRKKINCYMDWFTGSKFYYCNHEGFFLNDKNALSLFEKDGSEIVLKSTGEIISLNTTELKNPLFIGIDIDWHGESIGFKLLKEYRKNILSLKRPTFIFVFSRYESPTTIRRAIASGALFYVTKQNFMQLVPNVFSILRSLEKNEQDLPEIIQHKYNLYENWHLLSKLEPSVIVDLKSTVIKGFSYQDKVFNDDSYKFRHEYSWIHRLPKADLHCHIGSCLGPELLPLTALLVLAEKYKSDDETNKIKVQKSIQFVSIFVEGLTFENNKLVLKIPELSKALGIVNSDGCLFDEITALLDLKTKQKFPEIALLDPSFNDMDLVSLGNTSGHDFFQLRQELKKLEVTYDDIMLFFILMICIKENKVLKKDDFKAFLLTKYSTLTDSIEVDQNSLNSIIQPFIQDIDSLATTPDLDIFLSLIGQQINFDKLKNGERYILNNLQSAAGRSNSLFSYLRGCEYGGSPHLQTKSSIYLACHFIVHHYAIPDNIRYLTLRCAVDGYTKSNLISDPDEAMETLLNGFNVAVQKANKLNSKKIHVDLILTAKRHKSVEEFKQNAELALKYRNGSFIEIEKRQHSEARKIVDQLLADKTIEDAKIYDKLSAIKNLYKDDTPKSLLESETKQSFFDINTKVVSFDLAGLEKGNRASKYYEYFLPLLKKCFPITIHAGEEDSDEAIWEAIYEVQSQRIGHGLTLRNNQELLDIVKDRHIAIELCPLSNIYTKKDDQWNKLEIKHRNNKSEYSDKQYYPLRQYLMENLDVTINTDNPYVSDCTLTKEFLVSAWLAGGLTKWEVLRLIKNSFRSAALPKEQKRLLMNEIDDEIYNILLQESL